MRKFWAFYGLLPFALIILLFAYGFAGRTVAAPGIVNQEPMVRFAVSNDAPDPNVTLRLVNDVRATHNISELKADEALGRVAHTRALDMVKRNYYAHKDPDGRYYYDVLNASNISTGYNCENLVLVFVPNQNQVIEEWNASMRGHRECLLDKRVTHAGYATAKMSAINPDGTTTDAYLVVAIHAAIHD